MLLHTLLVELNEKLTETYLYKVTSAADVQAAQNFSHKFLTTRLGAHGDEGLIRQCLEHEGITISATCCSLTLHLPPWIHNYLNKEKTMRQISDELGVRTRDRHQMDFQFEIKM